MPNFKVQDYVDAYLIKASEDRQKERVASTSFHDSKAGTCLRQRIYYRAGLVRVATPPAQELRTLLIGSTIHEIYETALRKQGALALDENGKPLSEGTVNDAQSHGRYDFLIDFEKKGFWHLVDLKTASEWALKHIKKEGEAKYNHRLQMMRYWLKLKDKYPIVGIRVLYLNKATGECVEYDVVPSTKLVNETKADLQAEQNAWTAMGADPGKLTEAQFSKKAPKPLDLDLKDEKGKRIHWDCSYCNLADKCGPEYMKVSKYFKGVI